MISEWEADRYSRGSDFNRYPFDSVVSFVYRYHPRELERAAIRILEVGCGTGNNLWFAAREGFTVVGIDSSPTAIAYARRRFQEDGLCGDLREGDFTALSFGDCTFDLAIDRCALSYAGLAAATQAVGDIRRVLKPGGKFHLNVFSDRATSARSGTSGADGLQHGMTEGSLAGTPATHFWGREPLLALFRTGWRLLSLQHVEITDGPSIHAEWRAIGERL